MEKKILKTTRIQTQDLDFAFGYHTQNRYIVLIDKKLYNEEKQVREFLKDYKRDIYLLLNDKIDYITVEYSEVKY